MFFISYAPPYKPVSSRTLARWVSDNLHKAGIHTKTFKSHSLRSASTSNAFSSGLYLTEIAEAAGWANVETFEKFYNKPVIDNNFRNFLLDLQLYACLYILYAEDRRLYDICCFIYIPIWALKSHMNTYQA